MYMYGGADSLISSLSGLTSATPPLTVPLTMAVPILVFLLVPTETQSSPNRMSGQPLRATIPVFPEVALGLKGCGKR